MEHLKGATLACPGCGDHVEAMIPADTPVGTVEKRECPGGHDFWFRVLPGSLEPLPEAP